MRTPAVALALLITGAGAAAAGDLTAFLTAATAAARPNAPLRADGELVTTSPDGTVRDQITIVRRPNGDVYLCCMDWSLKHRLGSLATQAYEELFQGEEFRAILRGMTDESVESICRYCEWSCKDATR